MSRYFVQKVYGKRFSGVNPEIFLFLVLILCFKVLSYCMLIHVQGVQKLTLPF